MFSFRHSLCLVTILCAAACYAESTIRLRMPFPLSEAGGFVEGGIPIPQGAFSPGTGWSVATAEGTTLRSAVKPLTYWPDGTARWILVSLAGQWLPGECTLSIGGAPIVMAEPVPIEAPVLKYQLKSGGNWWNFQEVDSEALAENALYSEFRVTGAFEQTGKNTKASVSAAYVPGISATRYRVRVQQLENGDTWQGLRVVLPHAHAQVQNGAALGALVSASGESTTVTLILDGNHPVDRGVGRQWEIWAWDGAGEAPLVGRPWVPQAYLQRALGQETLLLKPAQRLENQFRDAVDRVFKARDEDPRNFGWRHYGLFFDRRGSSSLAYYGYLNQEYDPATALFLMYLATGQGNYLQNALDCAAAYRDTCISPEGGCYQHRATIHAGESHIIGIMAQTLKKRIAQHEQYAPTPEALVNVLNALYAPKFGDLSSDLSQIISPMADRPFTEQQETVVNVLSAGLLDEAANQVVKRLESLGKDEREALVAQVEESIRAWYVMLAKFPDVQDLGFTDVDRQFEGFFARYGGSWKDFPSFVVDLRPDRKAFEGGHSLVEMLVWGYRFTGDPLYRERALEFARHHIDIIVPFVLQQNEGLLLTSKAIHTRQLSWPLIALVSVSALTQQTDPVLDASIREAARALAHQLTKNPIDAHQGGIHAGVGMEALARYHELTGDPDVKAYLVKWADYWARTQWEPGKGFRYLRDVSGTGDDTMTALILYGLAYACELEPNPDLKERVLQAKTHLLDHDVGTYSKSFAMRFRSTPRAWRIISE